MTCTVARSMRHVVRRRRGLAVGMAMGLLAIGWPSGPRGKPPRLFIQAFAITTKSELAAPLTTIGIEPSQWRRGVRRSQPYK